MEKSDKVQNLEITESQKEFTSQRAMARYIGVNSRPDICATVQLIAPRSDPTSQIEFKLLEKVIKRLRDTSDIGFAFVRLEM